VEPRIKTRIGKSGDSWKILFSRSAKQIREKNLRFFELAPPPCKHMPHNYPQERACFGSGEIRILDSTGKLERNDCVQRGGLKAVTGYREGAARYQRVIRSAEVSPAGLMIKTAEGSVFHVVQQECASKLAAFVVKLCGGAFFS
jgi:hypothetical protein